MNSSSTGVESPPLLHDDGGERAESITVSRESGISRVFRVLRQSGFEEAIAALQAGGITAIDLTEADSEEERDRDRPVPVIEAQARRITGKSARRSSLPPFRYHFKLDESGGESHV